RRDELAVELCDTIAGAHFRLARSADDVGRRELRGAQKEAGARDAVTHRLRTHAYPAVLDDDVTAATQPDRKQVRHAEVRAHATDVHGNRGLARDALREYDDVGRGCACVH